MSFHSMISLQTPFILLETPEVLEIVEDFSKGWFVILLYERPDYRELLLRPGGKTFKH